MGVRRRTRFGDEPGDNDCAVCYECMDGRETIECSNKHKFCKSCINRWTHRNPTCPTCRADFPSPEQMNAAENEFVGPPDDDPRYLDLGDEQVGRDGNRWIVSTRRGRNVWAPVRTVLGFAMRNLNGFGKNNLNGFGKSKSKKRIIGLKQINKLIRELSKF